MSTIDDFDYYQNKDKGVTAVVINNTCSDAIDVAESRLGFELHGNYVWPLIKDMPEHVRGVTKLRSGDEWDSEYGFQRAERKALTTRKRLINNSIRNLVRKLIRDAVQLDRNEATKVMNDILSNQKKNVKSGVTD